MANTNPPPPLPVNNGLGLPPGATPKIIPLSVDLTAIQAYTVDLTQQQQQNNIGPIQTIYINNSGNAQSVTVQALISNISYTILPGDSAILPFFLPNQAPKFTVTSTGGVIIPIAVLDTPQPAQVWGASTNAGFNFTGGKLQVTDVALDALISNIGGAGNALDVNVITGGGGGSSVITPVGPIIQGTFNNGNGALDSGFSGATKQWFVTNVRMVFSGDLHKATANIGITATLKTLTSGNFAVYVFDYLAAAGVVGNNTVFIDTSYSPPLSQGAIFDKLDFRLSAVPDGGNIYVEIEGYQA